MKIDVGRYKTRNGLIAVVDRHEMREIFQFSGTISGLYGRHLWTFDGLAMPDKISSKDLIERIGNIDAKEQPTQEIVMQQAEHDPVNRPKHYTAHPSGIECIQITEHMGFNLGNATKYIWRCDLKQDAVEDLKKAVWYINREIERRTNGRQADK
jgi:hypothetical protein